MDRICSRGSHRGAMAPVGTHASTLRLRPMRVLFTADLIKSLTFERRPIAVDDDGSLVYDDHPAGPRS